LQASMLSMAVALILVWLSPDASGASTATRIDENQRGVPYAAGELLVTYDKGASRERIDEVVDQSQATVAEELPRSDAQLLSFPTVKRERGGHVREEKLQRAKEALQKRPGVEHVD
jgi:hypothetical protein